MTDSKAVATSDKKDKSSILDDDIGKDILSSWKSISVTADTEDFKLEPMGKSKKKDFGFDKMDMDFDLDGGFGKLSSFKMDMSDLDFSFPPKKNKKGTQTTERDSSRVNFQGKEDRFNFTFDFDNFDIDAALSKVDTLSSKQKDMQKHVADKTDTEVSEVQDNEVTVADMLNKSKKGQTTVADKTDTEVSEVQDNEIIVADMLNKPKRVQTSETVGELQVQNVADDLETLLAGNNSMRSGTSIDIVLQPGAETASDKSVHGIKENAVDRSCLPVDQPIVQEFDDQSLPTSNIGGSLMEPPEEGCSSGEIMNANVGGEQIICYEAEAEAVQPISPDHVLPQIAEHLEDNTNMNKILSCSTGNCTEEVGGPGFDLGGSPNKTSEPSQDDNHVNGIASNNPLGVKESSDGVSDSHNASVVSTVKKQHTAKKAQLSLLSSREPMVDKSPPDKEKESKLVKLKLSGKADEVDKPNHESSVFSKPKSSIMSATHSDRPPESREAFSSRKPIGIAAEGGFVSHKIIAKEEHALLRNQRTLITAKENSLHSGYSKSVEMSNKNESQKSDEANATTITNCTQSVRHISTAKDKPLSLKSVTRNLGLTDLKSSSRRTEEKRLQSISATTNEIKSFKDLKQRVVEDVTPKVAVLSLTEKQKLETSKLKRKQAPTGGQIHETPLKRLSQSPKYSSIRNVSDLKIQGQVQDKGNTLDISPSSHFVDEPKIPKFDTSGQRNSMVLEHPSDIGDFGMVEKAAQYGKDLEDLCNMLKKKNEEAKELLVRAVVNNNSLLLLNHPMHEEKIRSVQKLANRLMAMEIVPSW